MDEIKIYPSKSKQLRRAAADAVFLLIGLWMAFSPEGLEISPELISGLGILLILLSGFSLVFVLPRLFSPKPLLVISQEGISDNASSVRVGLIRWEEIEHVFSYTSTLSRTGLAGPTRARTYLGIVPKNLEMISLRLSPLKTLLLRANKVLFRAPINIPDRYLPVSIDELLERTREYREASSRGG